MKPGQNLVLECLPVGMLQTNCYLMADIVNKQAVVIDPGGNSQQIAARIEEQKLKLAAILNTHAHFDHIMDAWSLQERVGGKIYLHPREQAVLVDRTVGLGAVGGVFRGADEQKIDQWLQEGDRLVFGLMQFVVLETPGHSPGHVAFHCPDENLIFVGDALFAGSIGRTDFLGGSYEQLIASVREKIFSLDGKTVVYPGHGPATTVEIERNTNPFF